MGKGLKATMNGGLAVDFRAIAPSHRPPASRPLHDFTSLPLAHVGADLQY